ncbi:hypothetical protein LUD75_08915 [Epilithonimonas sp. JDS]|uniref:hypothetical protein n=1 Tax=Epilithonimonas sp. JDS TaxID=2902797 RepID=UPI001E2E06B9|nr:hypothetical protein [Epilithonimonas sp. JDS]MCD9854825.1 hypothetical protein [Epilithonimonas sp. JDS]
MIKKYFSQILKKVKRIKWKEIRSSNFISIIALFISLITFYYQFFNVKHEILYSNFVPDVNNDSDTLKVPVFFKNSGNQTEIILDGNLIMEVKTENNENYFKRIGDSNKNQFPIILNANENKYLVLSSNYNDYLFGSLEISPNGTNFREFTILDSLKLKMTTQFITKDGILSNDTIDVGYITFGPNRKIVRLDYNATKLRALNLNENDTEIGGGTFFSHTISGTVDLKNPADIEKHKAMLKYAKKTINDSTLNEVLEKVE